MTKYTLTPTPHHVFNEFDRHGLILGLERLKAERNPEYKRRLLDVFVHKADSTYMGLIHGITRELGLRITDTVHIRPVLDGDGSPLLPLPAVVFKNTKCYLYRDYQEDDLLLILDRFDSNGGAFTLDELIDAINDTGYFIATLLEGMEGNKRSMCIFNQSSIVLEADEDITGQGGKINLIGRNMIRGTIAVRSANLYRRVDSEILIRRPGDYMIDVQKGQIISSVAPAEGSVIRYEWRNDDFTVQASPVIIHNLQSDDFKTKMFEQIIGDDGDAANGLPTTLGASIINELLSVYPSSWGQ